jgi:hypothetical protein
MPTATQPLPPLPDPKVPFGRLAEDGKSVLVDPDWYRAVKRLYELARDLRLEIP